jgi:uncharacterized membrane protein
MRRGFNFPGSPEPTYLDFLYVSFTVGLTYAMSDVNVINEVQRRMVLIHSVVSFFFYSMILGVVLNAIVTSLYVFEALDRCSNGASSLDD